MTFAFGITQGSGDLPRAIFSLLMSLIIQLPELYVVLHLLLSGTPRIRFCDKHKLKLKTTNKNPAVLEGQELDVSNILSFFQMHPNGMIKKPEVEVGVGVCM